MAFKYGENDKFSFFMGRLADVALLNLLWIAACLPIVTIGAGTVAAYAVALKMVDDEEHRIVRSFFREFKASFLRGTALWFVDAAALYALYLGWQIALKAEDPPFAIIVSSIVLSIAVFCASLYAYPLLARYDRGAVAAVGNSLRICSRYPGRTAVLGALLAGEIILFSWNPAMIVLGVLAGPMILIFTVSGAAKRAFKDIERANGLADADTV